MKRLAGVITCALEHVKSPVAKAKLTAADLDEDSNPKPQKPKARKAAKKPATKKRVAKAGGARRTR